MPAMATTQDPSSAARWRARIQAARDGCRNSQNALIRSVRPLLIRLAERELNQEARQFIAASDVVQDVLVKANAGLHGFRGSTRAELLAWLRTILRNRIADEARRNDLAIIPQSKARERTDVSPTASQEAVADEETQRIEKALGQLPHRYEQAIRLRYELGLSYREMGGVLQCTEEAARKLWARAIKKLGRELKDG